MRTTGGKSSPHVSLGISKFYPRNTLLFFPLNRISDRDYISSLLTPSCGQWIMNGSDAYNFSCFSTLFALPWGWGWSRAESWLSHTECINNLGDGSDQTRTWVPEGNCFPTLDGSQHPLLFFFYEGESNCYIQPLQYLMSLLLALSINPNQFTYRS